MRTQFAYPPTVALLQALAPGSLKQNLPKAVRLWVILRSLYGSDHDEVKLSLREQFSYEEWRNQFFTQADRLNKQRKSEKVYHQRDEVPPLHDPDCRCAKILDEWLFAADSSLTIPKEKWFESFLQIYLIERGQLEQFLTSGNFPKDEESAKKQKPQTEPVNKDSEQKKTRKKSYVPPFPNGRLFAVTGKILEQDFETLVKMGWLTTIEIKGEPKKRYRKVQDFPSLNSLNLNSTTGNFITQADFTEIADNYFQPINGIQRFLMHVEYVVSKEAIDKIREWQDQLKAIWEKTPVPPLRIVYDSASLSREGKRIIYPVCIYYFQRAPYLCAFGQKPKNKNQIEWHNYRLDRIQDIEELSWDDENVPDLLKQKCANKQLPTPEEIQIKMAKAWGFDFYQPSGKMLLRFDREFHERYIINSFRHDTFTFINERTDFRNFIKEYVPNESEKKLLTEILESLPARPDDEDYPYAYYCVDYRADDINLIDNNVMMRLRAWGPKVEVLLPQVLRERMAKDIQDTWNLYHS